MSNRVIRDEGDQLFTIKDLFKITSGNTVIQAPEIAPTGDDPGINGTVFDVKNLGHLSIHGIWATNTALGSLTSFWNINVYWSNDPQMGLTIGIVPSSMNGSIVAAVAYPGGTVIKSTLDTVGAFHIAYTNTPRYVKFALGSAFGEESTTELNIHAFASKKGF